jgi:SAM-dependent methyltransferase
MLAIHPPPAEDSKTEAPRPVARVVLANGECTSLDGLTRDELHALQWEQEQKFARAIVAFPAGSRERAMIVGQAYDTISAILVRQNAADQTGRALDDDPLVMGLAPKYVQMVLQLLQQQVARGEGRPHLFEIGFGSGLLLKEVRDYGFPIGGVEVSSAMHQQAARLLGERYAGDLLLGDFRQVTAADLRGQPTLVYWNDVLEHVPVDEAADYVAHIHRLLAPHGQLVTITPNWLLRPSDATGDFCPPRTQARGLHLKEYRLAEIAKMLKRAGFRRVATPLIATRQRMVLLGGGACLAKRWLEPMLDRLPIAAAHLLCRGFAMSCTIATK